MNLHNRGVYAYSDTGVPGSRSLPFDDRQRLPNRITTNGNDSGAAKASTFAAPLFMQDPFAEQIQVSEGCVITCVRFPATRPFAHLHSDGV
jgi:hypothetical protein